MCMCVFVHVCMHACVCRCTLVCARVYASTCACVCMRDKCALKTPLRPLPLISLPTLTLG
jgi:hypothetical protein